jgi:hypothetical protein
MKKILFTLLILMTFIFCRTENENKDTNSVPEKKTQFITVSPQSFISQLPEQLEENSGLILFDNLLWTFNDSGGENKIFALNFSGEIVKEVTIENATNIDWEDIAQDNKSIYIGDFGNNNGVRNNQRIYQIKKKDLNDTKIQTITASQINFTYKDQEDFSYQSLNTPYDCEALVDFNESLSVFTKNWVEQTTSVYHIPKKEGQHKLDPAEKFEVNGLITGADISPNGKNLALVGYRNFQSFVWVFAGITKESFFQGEKIYMELDGFYNAQTEGICFKGNDSLLISCERTSAFNHQVFLIDLASLEQWKR